jgi:hypothetical protein
VVSIFDLFDSNAAFLTQIRRRPSPFLQQAIQPTSLAASAIKTSRSARSQYGYCAVDRRQAGIRRVLYEGITMLKESYQIKFSHRQNIQQIQIQNRTLSN